MLGSTAFVRCVGLPKQSSAHRIDSRESPGRSSDRRVGESVRRVSFGKVLRCLREDSSRLPSYLLRFGWVAGFTLWRRLRIESRFRLGPREIQVRVPQHRMPLAVRQKTSDVPTFESVFIDLQYQVNLKAPPRVIIDGGANVGYTSIFFALQYPSARIVAIEPERSNFELLVKNTAAYKNVMALQAALWKSGTWLEITNPQAQKWGFQVAEPDDHQPGTIVALGIADVLQKIGEDHVDLLKLDIEGSEKDLFASNTESWLSRVPTILIELHDWMLPGCSESVYRATDPYGFQRSQRGEVTILTRS